MKITLILVLSLLSIIAKSETFTVTTVVKSFRIDADQKNYRINLKGQQVTYKADEKSLPCLEHSLKNKKDVKFVIDGMTIVECKKI